MSSAAEIRFELAMGALCDDIESQLRRQGLTLGATDTVERVQRWANAITDLGIQEFLTNAERNKALNRLMKRISTLVLALEEEADHG